MAVVTPAQVAAELGRDLTAAEQSRVTSRVAAWTSILEGLLNRGLDITQRSVTKTPIPEGSVVSSARTGWSIIGYGWGVVWLDRPPIHSLDTVVTVDDDPAVDGTDITESCRRDGELRVLVPTLKPVRVTFTSGDEPVAPEVTDLVLDALVRTMSVPAAAAAGLDVSYSVEGESVTYGAQNTEGRRGPFTKAEVAGLRASLGRVVMR